MRVIADMEFLYSLFHLECGYSQDIRFKREDERLLIKITPLQSSLKMLALLQSFVFCGLFL